MYICHWKLRRWHPINCQRLEDLFTWKLAMYQLHLFSCFIFLPFTNIFTKYQNYGGADPRFFLGGGAPLRNDVTDREVKNFKSGYLYTKKKASSREGGGHTPCTLPLDLPLLCITQGSPGKGLYTGPPFYCYTVWNIHCGTPNTEKLEALNKHILGFLRGWHLLLWPATWQS